VHVYSSTDLYHWRDEGIALSVVKDDTTHDLREGCVLERPKVIYNEKTGQFVMWFHLEFKGTNYRTARSGVAVASQVTGPYSYVRSFRPNAGHWPKNIEERQKQVPEQFRDHDYSGGELPDAPDKLNLCARDFAGGQMARDQTLFVDDDGTAYHLYASEENSTLHISRLTDDYLSYAGDYIRVFEGRFMEAPAICKRDGKYYFIGSGCTGWAPNAARSAVAESIWGPWRELGNPCVGEDAETTFHSQSTFLLPVQGMKDAYIFKADRWRPDNAIDGRYIWLPLLFRGDRIELEWLDEWDLSAFTGQDE
ncbi:family 43 glycosylhydrolase, partial [candidate division KSB1 bacterium]|nr:family 43 glycosylhydrolase [candidate division KSB1 bacterium]